MAWIVGEVVSLRQTNMLDLIPAYLFHAASTALGAFLIARSIARKPAAEPKVPVAA